MARDAHARARVEVQCQRERVDTKGIGVRAAKCAGMCINVREGAVKTRMRKTNPMAPSSLSGRGRVRGRGSSRASVIRTPAHPDLLPAGEGTRKETPRCAGMCMNVRQGASKTRMRKTNPPPLFPRAALAKVRYHVPPRSADERVGSPARGCNHTRTRTPPMRKLTSLLMTAVVRRSPPPSRRRRPPGPPPRTPQPPSPWTSSRVVLTPPAAMRRRWASGSKASPAGSSSAPRRA